MIFEFNEKTIDRLYQICDEYSCKACPVNINGSCLIHKRPDEMNTKEKLKVRQFYERKLV